MEKTDAKDGKSHKPRLVIDPKGNYANEVFKYSSAVGDAKMDKAIAERQKKIQAKKSK